MTIETMLPLDNYASGDSQMLEVPIPDDSTEYEVRIARCTALQSQIWPDPETFVLVTTEYRVDGGAWQTLVNGEVEGWGGVAKNKFNQDIPWMRFSGHIPAGVNRELRGTITVEGGPARTMGEAEFFIPETLRR